MEKCVEEHSSKNHFVDLTLKENQTVSDGEYGKGMWVPKFRDPREKGV